MAGVATVGTQLSGCAAPEDHDDGAAAPHLLFDADINARGLDGYAKLIPEDNREGYGYHLVRDPEGDDRTVVKFTSHPDLTLGNRFARSMVETPPIIKAAAHGNEDDVYYTGFSMYLTDDDFQRDTWITVYTGGYGPPSAGPSLLGLMLVRHPDGGLMLRLGDDPGLLGNHVRVPIRQWVGVIQAYKYAYASNGGWLQMWLNAGDGWQEITIAGQLHPTLDVMRRDVTDGWYRDPDVPPSFSRIGVYGAKPYEAFFATHRIARSFGDVDPLRRD